jgi:Protein of unknown function (DUF3140)
MARTDPEADTVWEEFHVLVNMSSPALRDWLAVSENVFSQVAPGVPREEPDDDLPSLGWRVVEILGKRKTDVTEQDTETMRKVTEIIQARLDNRPPDGVNNDEWRRDLMLLGHDPLIAE